MVKSAPSDLPYACLCFASIVVDKPYAGRRVVADFTSFRSFGLTDLISQTPLPSILTVGGEEAPGMTREEQTVARQTIVGTARAAEASPNTGTGQVFKQALEKPTVPNERGASSAPDGLEQRLRKKDEKERHAAVVEATQHLFEVTQGMPRQNTNTWREVYFALPLLFRPRFRLLEASGCGIILHVNCQQITLLRRSRA